MAKAAEEKFDLILFQSLTVSMVTRWTSSRAAVAEFITACPSQPESVQSRVEVKSRRHGHIDCHQRRATRPRDALPMSSSSTQAINALEAQVNSVSSVIGGRA